MKISIFAPHQDDELNLFGPLFKQYLDAGFEISVIFVTNGDFFGRGEERYYESLKAAKCLGNVKIWYFGYPDRGYSEETGTIYTSIIMPCSSYNGKKFTYKPVNDELDNFYPHKFSLHPLPFTKDSILSTFIEYLKNEMPDIIISTSWDSHQDHRIVCQVLSEAIVFSVLNNPQYNPLYLEGFAYLGAWFGPDDYLSYLPIETKPLRKNSYCSPFPFKWEKRLNIYVDPGEVRVSFWKTNIFNAYRSYSTQKGLIHFFGAVNLDKCFWLRDTNNLALYAKIVTSSGDPTPINDFKLIDASDIRVSDFSIKNKSLIHWSPSESDDNPSITITFKEKKLFDRIVIHQGYDGDVIKCSLAVNDFVFPFIIDEYYKVIDLPYLFETTSLTMFFDDNDEHNIAIREIEIFNKSVTNSKLETFLSYSNKKPYKKACFLHRIFSKVIRRIIIRLECGNERVKR